MTKINESNASGIRAALDILNESSLDVSAQGLDFGFDPEAEVEVDDAAIDRWHDGALDAMRGKPKSSDDKDYLEGYAHGLEERKVQVVEPERPEGYYHQALGTFESEEVEEGGMPSSVIKDKQKMSYMSDEELAEVFKRRSETFKKPVEQLARECAWRHGYGKMAPTYWNRISRFFQPEVEEAAEFDGQATQHSKGEEFVQDTSMPGKAREPVRYTPARQTDNPMAEEISLGKSFLDYLKEAEDKEASDEEDASEN